MDREGKREQKKVKRDQEADKQEQVSQSLIPKLSSKVGIGPLFRLQIPTNTDLQA